MSTSIWCTFLSLSSLAFCMPQGGPPETKCQDFVDFGYFCVPYYQCTDENKINVDGGDLFDPRQKDGDISEPPDPKCKCGKLLEVWCQHPSFSRTNEEKLDVPEDIFGEYEYDDRDVRLTTSTTTTTPSSIQEDTPFQKTPYTISIFPLSEDIPFQKTPLFSRRPFSEDTPPPLLVLKTEGSIMLSSMENLCGRRPPNELKLAVSGNGQVNAPWAVSVGKYFEEETSFNHFCTGSILSPGIVLSAAHCITSKYFDRATFKVRAGVQNLKNYFGVESSIRKAVFHTKWQETGQNELYFDLALFFLDDPFSFSPSLQPICLPTNSFPSLPETMLGVGVTTVGWGFDDEDIFGEELTQIDVTIRSNEECNTKYNQTDRRNRIRLRRELPNQLISSQFCADNNINTGIGACNGDSGGPSFVRKFVDGEERFTILGVTSGSVTCGGGIPDFYSYLGQEEILPWIHRAAADDELKLSEFNHLEDNSWVHCDTGSECSSGVCEEGICIGTVGASITRTLGPSSKCTNEKMPCFDGNKCTEPSCNRYGNSCWCPRSKKRRSADRQKEVIEAENLKTFVTGKPEQWDIECGADADCPTDWYCAEQFCFAPLSFPSAARAALSAPVSGVRFFSGLSHLGSLAQDCLCKPDCTAPVCNSRNRCWCVARGWRNGARRRRFTRNT